MIWLWLKKYKNVFSFFLFTSSAFLFYLLAFSEKNTSDYNAVFDYSKYFIANAFLFLGMFVNNWRADKESFETAYSSSFGMAGGIFDSLIAYHLKFPTVTTSEKIKWVASWVKILALIFLIFFIISLKGISVLFELIDSLNTSFMFMVALGEFILASIMAILSMFFYFKEKKKIKTDAAGP